MVKVIKKLLKPIYLWCLFELPLKVPFLKKFYLADRIGYPATLKYFFFQKIIGFNRSIPWPVHFTSLVTGEKYISIGHNTAPGASIGNYIFATSDSPMYFGHYTIISSNVCIGSVNHDIYDLSKYTTKGEVYIGDYCWIGANAVILSGTRLGDHTVVAAGAVVNNSFLEGNCILAGNPAKIVKSLDVKRVVRFSHEFAFHGYKLIKKIG